MWERSPDLDIVSTSGDVSHRAMPYITPKDSQEYIVEQARPLHLQ